MQEIQLKTNAMMDKKWAEMYANMCAKMKGKMQAQVRAELQVAQVIMQIDIRKEMQGEMQKDRHAMVEKKDKISLEIQLGKQSLRHLKNRKWWRIRLLPQEVKKET